MATLQLLILWLLSFGLYVGLILLASQTPASSIPSRLVNRAAPDRTRRHSFRVCLCLRNGQRFLGPAERPAPYLFAVVNIVRNVIPKIRPAMRDRNNGFLVARFVVPFKMQSSQELGSFNSKLKQPVAVGFRNSPMAHRSKQLHKSNLAD